VICQRLLPANDDENQIDRKIVNLVRAALDTTYARSKAEQHRQTFEQLNAIRAYAARAFSELNAMASIPADPTGFLAQRSVVMRAVNSDAVKELLK
jgi:hypothetical protein